MARTMTDFAVWCILSHVVWFGRREEIREAPARGDATGTAVSYRVGTLGRGRTGVVEIKRHGSIEFWRVCERAGAVCYGIRTPNKICFGSFVKAY